MDLQHSNLGRVGKASSKKFDCMMDGNSIELMQKESNKAKDMQLPIP